MSIPADSIATESRGSVPLAARNNRFIISLFYF